MNKKIILSLLIIFCLLASVNFVLANEDASADKNLESNSAVKETTNPLIKINLKVDWKGDGSTPSSVVVNILKDGSVVKNVTLSKSNDWKADVELPSGNYNVREVAPKGYDVSYSGNQKTGFVITNAPISALAAGEDSIAAAGTADDPENDPENVPGDVSKVNENGENYQSNGDNNNVSDNESDNESNNETPMVIAPNNSTDDGNSTGNETNSTTGNTTKVITKTIYKVTKVPVKKAQQKQIPKAGNPIAVLVVVLIGIVVVSIGSRRK